MTRSPSAVRIRAVSRAYAGCQAGSGSLMTFGEAQCSPPGNRSKPVTAGSVEWCLVISAAFGRTIPVNRSRRACRSPLVDVVRAIRGHRNGSCTTES